eukprot:1850458-Alexandrium_andersonii.AAC.1
MSASLVGSEMCIRDSPGPFQNALPGRPPARLVVTIGCSAQTDAEPPRRDLLGCKLRSLFGPAQFKLRTPEAILQ